MSIFDKICGIDPIDEAIKNLQGLGKKFMNGLSEDNDLIEWDNNLAVVKSAAVRLPDDRYVNNFSEGIDAIFIKYLLKHHPSNGRLKLWFENDQYIETERQRMYRKMLILTLCEALIVVHKWEVNTKRNYEQLVSRIKEYVYYSNDYKTAVIETAKCASLSDEELLSIIKEIENSVMNYTEEQKLWHLKVSQLDTFKFK